MNDFRLRFVDWRRNMGRFLLQATTIFFIVLTLSLANASLSAASEPTDELNDESLPRVIVLSVADYSSFSSSGLRGIKHDVEAVEFFFRRCAPGKLLEYTQVDPEAATPEAVLNAIQKIKEKKVGKNDVVVFYYTGHAAYDGDKGGHYFTLKDANGNAQALYRSDVKSRLIGLGARLIVIFTDCCNTMNPVPEGMAYEPNAESGTRGKKIIKDYSPVMKSLFVNEKTRGVVDLTSSVPGEYSYAFEDGSVATTVAIKTFEQLDDELEKDSSLKVDWRRFVDDWTKETEEFSRERREGALDKDPTVQEKQTPHVYELPDSHRLGARVVMRNGLSGVQIREIVPNSPAEKIGLKVEDVILRIGDQTTVTEQDYNRIVDSEPRKTSITFVRFDKDDKENDGKEQTIKVELLGTPRSAEASDVPNPDDSTSDSNYSNESNESNSNTNESESVQKPKEHEPFVGLAFVRENKIAGVAPNSPAEDAGLKVGDVVGAFDGQEIYDFKDYEEAVASAADEAVLSVRTKDGQKLKVRVIGIRTKPLANQNPKVPAFSGVAFSRNESDLPKVLSVKANSPASVAGVQIGDVVRQFDGKEIADVKDYDDALTGVSDQAELVVLRKGKLLTLTLTGLRNGAKTENNPKQGSSPNAQNGSSEETNADGPVFGAGLNAQGNEIREVVPDSPADKAGLRVGDKLLKFDGKTIANKTDFIKAVDEAESSGRSVVVVEYESSGARQTKNVKLNIGSK